MAKVLLAWEMGLGIGYAKRVLSIARALFAEGHEPVLAFRDVERFWALSIDDPFPVIQAPQVVGRLSAAARRHGFRPSGFADLLECNGFGSYDHLMGMVQSWCGVIDVVKPDLIVATYSPLLALAAFGRIPTVLFGHAYLLPPVDEPVFPHFSEPGPARADQRKMLRRVNEVQRRFGHPELAHLTDFHRGDARFIISFPELDPYQPVRCEPVSGPLQSFADLTPAPERPRFYAYLAGDHPMVETTVRGLAASGLPGEIFIRNTALSFDSTELARTGIELLRDFPSLQDTVRRASVIVSHASADTVQTGIAAGRPQVMVPLVADQTCTARAAEAHGLGVQIAANATPQTVASAVLDLVRDRQAAKTLGAYADAVRARNLHGQLRNLVSCCTRLLG